MSNVLKLAAVNILAFSLAGLGACARQPDVKATAQAALDRAQIKGVNLDWENDARVMHLKGSVNTDEQRARAEQVVTDAIKGSGKVANELTIEGADEHTANNLDDTLDDHIKALFEQDPALKARSLGVEVNNGVVTLKGEVGTATERQRAFDLASKVPGVQQVVNSITVGQAE